MHCPSCGVEVFEQAVYCHKCGKRLDLESQQFPPLPGEQIDPAADQLPDETPNAAAEPPSALADSLQGSVADRQGPDEQPERELWQGGYSSKAMLGAWVLSGLITLVLLILGIYFPRQWVWLCIVVAVLALWAYQMLKLLYRRLNVRYTLTTLRFVHETGVLRRVTDRIEVIDMDDISVDQKILERMVGVGTIRISSSDTTHPTLVMPGIEHVQEVGTLIDETRRKERHRRGLHIESI